MLFNSPIFLFAFVPITFIGYFFLPRSLRNYFLILASLTFYAWGEPKFIVLVIGSTLLDWLLGNAISHDRHGCRRTYLLWAGIIANLAILFYFKYAEFFVDNLNTLLDGMGIPVIPALQIALPIGVSFIVFEKITYLVDIYKGIGAPAPTLASYCLYVLLFPKLLAGPIVKYHDIAGQLGSRGLNVEDFCEGLQRFLIGLAKKVLIADTLQEVVDPIFKLSPHDLGADNAWIGVTCFALQIYFDFSGYSDMAIGLARMMGFRLLENFNNPYISQNFTEFWRRWHISLSTWIREYLYIPLGGNRVRPARMYLNLLICFSLCGLWHGASWTFVFWGVYHGLFLILDKAWWIEAQKSFPPFVNRLVTFLLIMIGWAIFRAENFPQATYYLSALLGLGPGTGSFVYLSATVKTALAVGLFLCFHPLLPGLAAANAVYRRLAWQPVFSTMAALLLLIASVAKLGMTTFNPFLYFRF